jgi:hypothetical protein
MSPKVVRKIFAAEPGVLKIDRPELRNKRGYCSLYIPESVAVSFTGSYRTKLRSQGDNCPHSNPDHNAMVTTVVLLR